MVRRASEAKAFLTESAGKAISGAIWLKDLLSKDKRAKIITMSAGIAVDYGYDRLMAYADIEEAKAELSTFLQKWDSDLNEQQADMLANVSLTFAKEAGRVLTHKYANKGVNVIRDKLKGPEQQPLVFYKEYTSGKKEIKNVEINPYSNKSKQELIKSKSAYERLIKEHELKIEEFNKNPIGNSAPEKLSQMSADNPTADVLLERVKQRITALEKQLKKQRGELKKINDALEDFKSE